jgi:hypothetical protein
MPNDAHDEQPPRDTSLQVVATVSDESIAALLAERLQAAGVPSILGGSALGEDASAGGNRQVLVQVSDVPRAREIIEAQQGAISEDELIQAEEEDAAARQAREAGRTQLTRRKGVDPETGP